MDTLPNEILCQWIVKTNSSVCKLWRQVWFIKPLSIKFKTPFDEFTDFFGKFRCLMALELDSFSYIDWSIESLSTVKSIILNANVHTKNEHLQYLTHLTSLSLIKNHKITSIKNLTNITDLDLSGGNEIMDSEIYHLTQITKLNLDSNVKITDISLRYLTKLKYLRISFTRSISDISISRLINLESLSMCDCYLVSDRSIQCLINLTNMDLNCMPNVTHKSFKCLTNLTTMRLYWRKLMNDDILALTNLQSLEISNMNQIKIAKRLTQLKMLTIDNHRII
jgi:hypothetical protein